MDLVTDLAKEGLDIAVIAPELQSPRRWRSLFDASNPSTRFPIYTTKGPRPPTRLGMWAQRACLTWLLDTALKVEGRPDKILVLSGVHALGLEAWVKRAAPNTPIILSEHHSGLSQASLPDYWQQAYRALLASLDQCFAVSAGQAALLGQHYGGSWSVIPNAIDPAFFERPSSRQCQDLLYVGNFKRSKGLFTALEALELLPKRRLTCIGSGTRLEKNQLKKTILALGLANRVTIAPPQPPHQLAQTMARHTLLIQPSSFETFSLVVHEALTVGLPVASTACCGPEQILGQAGYATCPPNDAKALAQLIETHSLKTPPDDLMQSFRPQVITKRWLELLSRD